MTDRRLKRTEIDALDKPDLLIIGLDRLGLDLAMAASALGARVVLAMQGENALDHACRDGELLTRLSNAPFSGSADFHRALEALAEWITRTRSPERLRATRISVEPGEARFLDQKRIAIGERIFTPRRIVIATGRKGGDEAGLFKTEGRSPTPKRILVSGTSVASIALASLLLRSGSKVSLVGNGDLPGFDPENAALLLEALERQGLTRLADVPALRPADVPLWPEPRLVPALDGLDLEKAGIALRDGALRLGGHLETNRGRISAIGTVTGTPFGESVDAGMVGYLLARLMFRKPGRYQPPCAMRAIGTKPCFAEVGLTEAEARASLGRINIHRAHSGETGVSGDGATIIKLIGDAKGNLVGASLLSPEAAELAAALALAIQNNLGLEALSRLSLPVGSGAEALRLAATAPQRAKLRSTGLQRALRMMRRFG